MRGSRIGQLPLYLVMLGSAMIGMTSIRFGGFTLADLVFLAAAGLVALEVMNGQVDRLAPLVARKAPPLLMAGLLTLTLGGLLATFVRSLDPVGSALVLARLWYITVLWFWTLRTIISSERALRQVLIAMVVGAVINGLVGIQQDLTGSNEGEPNWGRSSGLTDHFNGFSVALASIMPILVAWRPARPRSPGWPRLAAMGIVMLAIGMSGSMTALAAAIGGCAVTLAAPWFLAGSRRMKRQALPVALWVVVGVAVMVTGVVSLSVTERLSDFWSGDNVHINRSVGTRGELNEHAFESALESPIVGVGLDDMSSEVTLGSGGTYLVHSAYLRLLYSAGVLGMLGIVLCLVMAYNHVVLTAKYLRRSRLDWVPAALLGSLAVVSVNGLVGPGLFDRYFWAPIGFLAVVMGLCRADAMRRARGEPAIVERDEVASFTPPVEPSVGSA